MAGSLDGKVALVTGSSRGIGAGIALRLGMAGATVVVCARTVVETKPGLPGTIQDLANEVEKVGGKALAVAANLTSQDDRRNLIETVHQELGGIDILVNNAAVLYPGASADFPEKRYNLMFNILVQAPFELAQAVIPDMREKGAGWILNISSRAAIHPEGPPYQRRGGGAVYGMTKAAIERFSTGLAAELYDDNIAVNALSPNLVVATPGQMFGRDYSQEMIDRAEKTEVIAEAAHYLCSSDPKEVTGRITYSMDLVKEAGLTPKPLPTIDQLGEKVLPG